MESRNRRHFIRVNVNHEAVLDFGLMQNEQHAVSNLSLGGMFVAGQSNRRPGDICLIRLKTASEEIKAKGSVVRVGSDGMALKFTAMPIDSFLFLQTILSAADGTFAPAEEPVSRIGFAHEDSSLMKTHFWFTADMLRVSSGFTLPCSSWLPKKRMSFFLFT